MEKQILLPAHKAVLWVPAGDCPMLARALGAKVLHPSMSEDGLRRAIDDFRATDHGALIVCTDFPVHGYTLGPAKAFFLEGCPRGEAWRTQARYRSERIA